MLDVVQAIVAEALKAFAPTPSAPPAPPGDRARRIGEKANRLLLAFRDARNEIEQAKDDLTDEIETVKKARKPHDAARKRG
jgi:hypothetical protein